MSSVLQVIAAVTAFTAAVLAPYLVYRAQQSKLARDTRVSDEAGLWERMATMVDRYGKRAEELEADIAALRNRVTAAEQRAGELEHTVALLRGEVKRWRSFAIALTRQLQIAGIAPVLPADFGLDDEEG